MRPAGQEQIDDLRQALALAPDDPRYRYHLGLALHRIGDSTAASDAYRDALQRGGRPDAAIMLALAELEQNPAAELAAIPGDSPLVRQTLAPVQDLLLDRTPPEGNDALDQLWHGLGLLQNNDAAAREVLADAHQLPSRQAGAMRDYYRGIAAARADDMEGALEAWQHLREQPADTPWLRRNISAALIGALSEEEAGAGDAERALRLALKWQSLAAASPALSEALIQTFDRAAHSAASAGDWERAAAIWEQARQVLSSTAGLGSARPLLHNLALAYEAQERWAQAADSWRAMLRTRPRRAVSKTEPLDSRPASDIADDEARWAWVRARVVEDYKRAGTPEEAVAVYRQAIKADPDDLDMRLQLADALVANEQEQAAINELRRVLQIDPGHVEAQVQLAGVYMDMGYLYAAEPLLRSVLEQHPDRAGARRAMSRLLLEHGKHLHSFGLFDQAVSVFEEGQRVAPDDYHFPLELARIAAEGHEPDRARGFLQRVLTVAGSDSFAYLAAIECWAALGDIDEARAVLQRPEGALQLEAEFYLDAGLAVLRHAGGRPPPQPGQLSPLPSPTASPVTSFGEEIIDRAMALSVNDAPGRAGMIGDLLTVYPDLALRYAEAAYHAGPHDSRTLMVLGLTQALNNRDGEAKDMLRRAAAQARREGDTELVRHIDMLRRQVGTPLLSLMIRTLPLMDDLEDDLFD